MVREPDATMQLAPQDIQLVSKHRVLSFKPQLRLEWQSQDGQSGTEHPDHSASLKRFHHVINSDKVFDTHKRQWAAFIADIDHAPRQLALIVDDLAPFLMDSAAMAHRQALP